MNHNDLGFLSIILIVIYDLYKDQMFFLNVYIIGSFLNYYLNKFLNKNTDFSNDREDDTFKKPSLLIQHITYSIVYLSNLTNNNLLLFICCIILFTIILLKIKFEENSNLQILSGILFGLFSGYFVFNIFDEINKSY